MRISPSNQTLLLASERKVPNSSTELSAAVDAATRGGSLKRVTIVATQPDTRVVYVQADYATESESSDDDASPPSSTSSPVTASDTVSVRSVATQGEPTAAAPTQALVRFTGGSRDAWGNRFGAQQDSRLSSFFSPAEQYARTQRTLGGAAGVSPQIDVLA